MPGRAESQRNNIRMGIFVSLSLLLGVGVVVALTGAFDALRGATNQHTVRFTVQSGVSNLKPGSEVRVGGMRLGEVTALRPRFEIGEPFRYIDVDFNLDRNVRLYDNARILVTSPLIGAEAWLDITSVGDGAVATGSLHGADRVGMLTSLLGDEGAAHAQQMLEDSRRFTEFLASVQDEYDSNVMPILENIQNASVEAQELAARIRGEDWPRWADSFDTLLSWAVQSTQNVDAIFAEGQGLLVDGREVIADNREDVRETIANVRAASETWRTITQRINDETIQRVHALLESGQAGLDELHAAISTLRSDYDGWSTAVSESLGRANIASQQLSLTMTEVRRSPWKVLYRPSEKELEHELLYEAARSFAVAAADLKSASTAMQRVMDNHSERLQDDEVLLQRVTQNLVEPLERYELAQQRLLDVLFADR